MAKQLRLGIIGLGSIGQAVAAYAAGDDSAYCLTAVCDNHPERSRSFLDSCNCDAKLGEAADVAAACDVLVEAAAAAAVPEVLDAACSRFSSDGAPSHVVVLSVGGLLDIDLDEYSAREAAPVLHAPSGAIGGLDALSAMREAGLDEVTLTTRKPPAGLGLEIDEEQLLFEGSAAEVFKHYPKNVNVAVALSLAGLGPQRTQVRLIADPKVSRNTHCIKARGRAGEMEFISRNEPFPDNPRTSYLAALSAISLLRRIASNLQVG